jgi:hypothetical protein
MTERGADDDVHASGTFEQRMLDYAERQTRSLESLRNFAFIVLSIGAVGLLIWVIALFGAR